VPGGHADRQYSFLRHTEEAHFPSRYLVEDIMSSRVLKSRLYPSSMSAAFYPTSVTRLHKVLSSPRSISKSGSSRQSKQSWFPRD
jgi:hypothetical protein